MMITLWVALLCSMLGVGSLYASWRSALPRSLAVPAGWLLLVVSGGFWMLAAGSEFGLVYAFLAMSFSAWLAVACNYKVRRKHANKPLVNSALLVPVRSSIWRHLLLFLGVVPLGGYAAILLSVTLVRQLPWSAVNALVTGILLLPVIWGLAAYWVCADSRPLRPVLTLASCCLLCASYIYG